MPIYEYRCPRGHTFELFQRINDAAPPACEICGAAPVQRVLYPAAIHFKGSGFYTTDYGRGNRKRESRDGDTPAETKPAEKKTGDKTAKKVPEA
jgi:putative FmdB family regulatory protein